MPASSVVYCTVLHHGNREGDLNGCGGERGEARNIVHEVNTLAYILFSFISGLFLSYIEPSFAEV